MINPEKSLKVVPARHFRRAKYGLDKFILIGRRKIHYVEAGNGAPILLIPGSSSTHRAWSRLIPLLSGDCRLLAFDFPIDPSSSEQVGDLKTVQIWSDLIATLIKQLNLEKVKLIGWGFGGAIALRSGSAFYRFGR